MNIGNKIRELRKQRGITQEQLAESIGISFQAVSKWEKLAIQLQIPAREMDIFKDRFKIKTVTP